MPTSSENIGIDETPNRLQPSLYRFPFQSNRAGYKPYSMPLVLVAPYRRDKDGIEIPGSQILTLRYFIEDVPQQAIVAGYDHKGIKVPEFERFSISLNTEDIVNARLDFDAVNFFRRVGSTWVEIDRADAVEGDFIETQIDNGVAGRVIYYPDAEYYDLSGFSIPTVELPSNRYKFVWEATYNRRIAVNEQFACVGTQEGLSMFDLIVACPGEVHQAAVDNMPSLYFDGNDSKDEQDVVNFWRPLADSLQNVFDEQSLLRRINWVDRIPAQLVPYLSYLIGVDLPNFPDVSDRVRFAMVKRGVHLQKLKGSKRAIRELFEIFGFTVDIINLWYLSNGEGFVAPDEDLPDGPLDKDQIESTSVCQYDLLLNEYSTSGFGESEVPLLYRPESNGNITLHAYLVVDGGAADTILSTLVTSTTTNLEALNSATCGIDLAGFHTPDSITDQLGSAALEGFSQVLITNNGLFDYSVGTSVISKESVGFNRDTSTIRLNFDGHQDFVSQDGSDLKLYVFAQYQRQKITLPPQLDKLRSNRFDLNITFKDGEIITPNLFQFLIEFVLKFKAFHSLLRKITFNVDISEVYNVTDFCVGGDYKERPGTDAGELQVPPAIIPLDGEQCDELEDRGFKEADLIARRKILAALEAEFDAWKDEGTSKDLTSSQRMTLGDLSNLNLSLNSAGCGLAMFGQDRIVQDISVEFDQDHDIDERDVVCDLTTNTSDYCYKGRVKDELHEDRIVDLTEYISCNPCSLPLGNGRYFTLPNGTLFDKTAFFENSELHKRIKNWKGLDVSQQLYYSNRLVMETLLDVYKEPATAKRVGLQISLPWMLFPGHRFVSMSNLENDFTHSVYDAKPYDDYYAGTSRDCRELSQFQTNPLNARLEIASDGNETLVWDDAPLIYAGNGVEPDISGLGSHDLRSYQVTHAIFTTADYNPLAELDGTMVHITQDLIIGTDGLYGSYNSDCETDYADGYPAIADYYDFDPTEYGIDEVTNLTEVPDQLLFKLGSGIICADLTPPSLVGVTLEKGTGAISDVDDLGEIDTELTILTYSLTAGSNPIYPIAYVTSTSNATAVISQQLPSTIAAGSSGLFGISILPGSGPFSVTISIIIGGVSILQFTISGTGTVGYTIDFSGVPDGAYTMAASLREDLADTTLFGLSGAIYATPSDNEMSYSAPTTTWDLNGETQVFVASLLRGTGVYHALMLENGVNPGGWGLLFGREIVNGYQFNLISTNLHVNRVIADVPTSIATIAIGSITGDEEIRVVATVGGSGTLIEVFLDDISKGSFNDTLGSRWTNFRVGGFSVNSGNGNGYGVINFRVGPGDGT